MAGKKTMTLNLSEDEMAMLEELSSRNEMSKSAIVRKALRMYQVIDMRLLRGEKLFVEDVVEKKKSEILLL